MNVMQTTDTMRRWPLLPLLLMLGLALALTLAGCGKKGMPQPKDKAELFSWKSASATGTSNNCLAVQGELQGNVSNVEAIFLELQTMDSAESCPGCPFTPNETTSYAPQVTGGADSKARLSITYCPQRKASVYRWRLVGRSVYAVFPHELSPVQTVVMPGQ